MKNNKNRVHIDHNNAKIRLKNIIYKHIKSLRYKPEKELIILCVGTDRSTGDALGPLTGTILNKHKNLPIKIIGNIDEPVHAENIYDIKKDIKNKFKYSFIIAVDAGLGKKSSVGLIDVNEGPLKPGTGVDKDLTEVGDMHITGLVNVSGYMEYLVLQSTRLSFVMKMAKIIAGSIKSSVLNLQTERKQSLQLKKI